MDQPPLNLPAQDEALRSLLTAAGPAGNTTAALQLKETGCELQLSRHELEVQNRTLHDTQQKLEEAVHRYNDLYDSLPIGYITLTKEGRITEANLAAAELILCERPRLIGRYFHHFVAQPEIEAFTAHLQTCAQQDDRVIHETILEVTGGPPVFVQLSSQRFAQSPELLIRAAISDISQLKKTQHVLEETVAEQESFAYSISHDLRAPLITITSFAKLLTQERANSIDAEAREILQRIERAGNRLDELLCSLLDYSRISRAQMAIEEVDLNDVIQDLLIQHHGYIKDRKTQIEFPSGLPRVRGSQQLLSQALSNLLTNALKYTPKDVPPVVRIDASQQGNKVLITVADEGIGIAPRHHDRIFRIFERLHGQSAYPGTGIGLALVRRAVERMNGRIWVESDLGKGSRFFIELPAASEPAA